MEEVEACAAASFASWTSAVRFLRSWTTLVVSWAVDGTQNSAAVRSKVPRLCRARSSFSNASAPLDGGV